MELAINFLELKDKKNFIPIKYTKYEIGLLLGMTDHNRIYEFIKVLESTKSIKPVGMINSRTKTWIIDKKNAKKEFEKDDTLGKIINYINKYGW